MPIAVTCACGKKYEAPDAAAGKKLKCKKCGAVLAVPAAKAGPVVKDDDEDYGLEGAPPAPKTAPKPAPPKAAAAPAPARPAPPAKKPANAGGFFDLDDVSPALMAKPPAPPASSSTGTAGASPTNAGVSPLAGAAAPPGKPSSIWKMEFPRLKAFALGFVIIGGTIIAYLVLANLERSGGSARMPGFVVVVYKILGKYGVLAIGMLLGIGTIVVGVFKKPE